MSTEEIETLVKGFGYWASELRKAGADGIELHGHEGYLFDQFSSSAWNKRTDKYGGDLEERLTFAGESFVTGPDGRIIAQAPAGEDAILYADIDFAELDGCAARKYFYRDRRPETYGSLTEKSNR